MSETTCQHGYPVNDPHAEPCYRKGCYEPKRCDHIWEYVNGPDHAANFLCSRCEAELVVPIKIEIPS